MTELAERGLRLGLISNTHRSLTSFQSHFELERLISGAISSSEHGFMKPHPSIFQAGLKLLDVVAGEAMMVGDSLKQDIEGARQVGMHAVLVNRSSELTARTEIDGVPVIRTLTDLPRLLTSAQAFRPAQSLAQVASSALVQPARGDGYGRLSGRRRDCS